jgi:sec-independent protein translocase protein TatA
VVLVVFGSKRLPDSARALGKSLRILKAETKGLRDDDPAPLPAGPTAPEHRFDPLTGEPLKRFDPVTGERLGQPESEPR